MISKGSLLTTGPSSVYFDQKHCRTPFETVDKRMTDIKLFKVNMCTTWQSTCYVYISTMRVDSFLG